MKPSPARVAARALNSDDYTDEVFSLKVNGTTVEGAVRAFARELIRNGQQTNALIAAAIKQVQAGSPGVYVDRRRLARMLLPVFQEVWGEDAVGVVLTRGLATGDSTFY